MMKEFEEEKEVEKEPETEVTAEEVLRKMEIYNEVLDYFLEKQFDH